MKAAEFGGIIIVMLFCAISFGTIIYYEPNPMEEARWQYTFSVVNNSLAEPIQEFTIWFDYGKYGNLTIETGDPLAYEWDEVVWQPESVLEDAGAYDALALVGGIEVGLQAKGFRVSFDWMGEGDPGSQFYKIVDPDTFDTIEEGLTILIPEPATLFLLAGSLMLYRTRKG